MGFAGADDVVKTAIQAMTKMGKEYSSPNKWTWSYIPPWAAPEYLYTVAIAQKLAKPANRGVYLEYNIKRMVKDAVIEFKPGRPLKYPKQSRCDIFVADGKTDIPRICLEVKTGPNIYSDVERCMKIVSSKDKSKLRDAAVIFMDSAAKEETLKNRYHRREAQLNEYCKKNPVSIRLAALSEKGGVVNNFDSYKTDYYEYDDDCDYRYGHWYVGAVKISWSGK